MDQAMLEMIASTVLKAVEMIAKAIENRNTVITVRWEIPDELKGLVKKAVEFELGN